MTTTFLEFGGEKRPFRFSYEGLLAYETLTGRSAIADFSNFNAEAPTITFMVNIAYAGLYAGYRREKIPIYFDVEDVAEWLGKDPAALNEIMALFAASFPKADEKKTTPQRVKAKT